jgi:hypothetical protein
MPRGNFDVREETLDGTECPLKELDACWPDTLPKTAISSQHTHERLTSPTYSVCVCITTILLH